MLLAPLVRDRKGEHEKLLAGAKQAASCACGSTASSATSTRRSCSTRSASTRSRSWSTGWSCAGPMTTAAPRPDAARMADSIETALRLSDGTLLVHLPGRRRRRGATGCTASSTPAPSTAAASRSRRPATSASTRRTAHARPAPGSASRLEIDPDLVLPEPDALARRGRGAAVAAHGRHRLLVLHHPRRGRGALTASGPIRPSASSPRGARRSCCAATTASASTSSTSSRQGQVHSYTTTFEGVLPNLERRYRETSSEATQTEIERYMTQRPCPTCNGMRLKPESLSVTVGGKNIIETTRLAVTDALAWYARLPELPERAREPDRPPGAQGDPGAARLPGRRRPRLPDPRPAPAARFPAARRSASGWRPDRLEPDGRALHPRRAVDRPAPARQRPAHRDADPAARPRQHAASWSSTTRRRSARPTG